MIEVEVNSACRRSIKETLLLLGPSEIFWAFPALMVAYFMLDARQATILTGAGNRRAQGLKLDSVSAIFRRNASPVSLLILDIDHFKRINDKHGHIAGDRILIELNELIRSNTRATESLYRYGGEEFVLVAEQAALVAAVELAEKVRSLIERRRFAQGIKVTVSIGVAQLQEQEDSERWLSRADAALYRAKGSGRNQVVTAAARASSMMLRVPAIGRVDTAEIRPVVLSHSM